MGTYFACQACKSAQYARDGTMILARVAIGDPHYATEVNKEVRRPPTKNGRSMCCDSIIARPGPMRNHQSGHQAHQEFVIFEQMQAYPEYVHLAFQPGIIAIMATCRSQTLSDGVESSKDLKEPDRVRGRALLTPGSVLLTPSTGHRII